MSKRRYLVGYDYGQGGVWAFVVTDSRTAIISLYPERTVYDEPPSWMTPADVDRIAESMTIDLEERANEFFARLRDARAALTDEWVEVVPAESFAAADEAFANWLSSHKLARDQVPDDDIRIDLIRVASGKSAKRYLLRPLCSPVSRPTGRDGGARESPRSHTAYVSRRLPPPLSLNTSRPYRRWSDGLVGLSLRC